MYQIKLDFYKNERVCNACDEGLEGGVCESELVERPVGAVKVVSIWSGSKRKALQDVAGRESKALNDSISLLSYHWWKV